MINYKLRPAGIAALALLAGVAVVAYIKVSPKRNEGLSNAGSLPNETEKGRPTKTTEEPAPAYQAPQVDDPKLADFVNRESHGQRVHDDMTSRFPALTSERDIAAVAAVLKDRDEADDTVRHEAAAMLARSGYKNLVPDLLAVLNDLKEKDRFRSWVVQHLQQNYATVDRNSQAAIRGQIQASLSDRDIHVRRESMLGLYRISPEEALPLARECLRDDSEAADPMRDLAIRIVRERDDRDELAEVRKYARHKDVEVRRSALVTLAAWKDEDSRVAMEDAAKSENPLLRRCGEMALKKLAKAPDDGMRPPLGRPGR